MKYVIIGAGAAGINAAETIRKLDKNNEILLISEDDRVYSRCMLHSVISGKRSANSISFVTDDFFKANSIQWLKGMKVVEVNSGNRTVMLHNGHIVNYDRLLLATGSKATVPPIKGFENAENLFKLRNISDVNEIINATTNVQSAVVIGAGLIGLDIAESLMSIGIKVSVVEKADRILPLQLDSRASGNYQKLFEQNGATFYTGSSICEAASAENRITTLTLSSGEQIRCDMIVSATGMKPNIDFVKNTALRIDQGIVVNDQMQTSLPDIFAAGDVTGFSGIWPCAVKQGIVAAHNMVGIEKHFSDTFTAKNSINLFGLETVSIGIADAPDPTYTVNIRQYKDMYKKIIHRDGIIHGVIMQKDIGRCGFWAHLIKEKISIHGLQKDIFDLSYADFFDIDIEGNFSYQLESTAT